jgi:hypothetical protein
MGVKLVSSGGGSVEINPPATASNYTATMPAGTGNVVVSGVNSAITAATAVASTSGTSIDFTGIPSWVKRITVMFAGVSTNGSSPVQIQVGAGSVATSGYLGAAAYVGSSTAGGNSTAGFAVEPTTGATVVRHGLMIITLLGSNTWVASSQINRSDSAFSQLGGGSIALGGTLDRVRITTVNGTDTFDAGSINILYE